MVIAADIGNSNIVIGCFQGEEIRFVERICTKHTATALEYAMSLKTVLELYGLSPAEISGAIVSSVVPAVTLTFKEAIRKLTGQEALVVGPGLKTGLSILIDNPAQLGSDLVVDAVAGIAEYPVPQIIIDMGTATTISVIDQNRCYLGGMIQPGVGVALDSLTGRTSQLPKIGLEPPKKLVGSNTVDCMKSGILYGTAAMLDGLIARINDDRGCTHTVIATGGLAPTVVPLCQQHIIADDALLLKGLRIIYRKNAC